MKRLPVLFSETAMADISATAVYVGEQTGSLDVALGFVSRIEARCLKIGDAPNGGAPRPDLGEWIRMVPFERSAVILHKVHADHVEVVTIVYGGRDYEALMRSTRPG